MSSTRLSTMLYRFLLRAYPKSLRNEHGVEMLQLFRDRLAEEREARGARGVVYAWWHTLLDLIRSAPRERIRVRQHRVAPENPRRSTAHGLAQDVLHAMRLIRRSPGFTFTVTAILATGIGATTAIFTLVQAVLLAPLPYPESERLVTLWENNTNEGGQRERVSPVNFIDWREAAQVFDGMASWREHPIILHGGEGSIQVPLARVTADFFAVAGVEPLMGRTFRQEEVERARYDQAERFVGGGHRVMVLSHGLWQQRFGSDPDILGRLIQIEGGDAEVIGVMPPEFRLPSPDVQLWTPVAFRRNGQRNARFIHVFARLRRGVDLDRAQPEMDVIASDLAARHPDTNQGWGITMIPFRDELVGDVKPALLIMMGAVAAVLLIVCANVAGMQLARGSTRLQEASVRVALGASRSRLFRQFLTESLVLSILGGALGFLLAFPILEFLVRLQPHALPQGGDVHVDLVVLAFAVSITVVTGIAFGVTPALQVSRSGAAAFMSQRGGRGGTGGLKHQRTRRLLVAAEVAIALVLLATAGLLMRSFAYVRSTEPGFEAKNALVLRVFLDKGRYGWNQPEAPHPRDYYRDLLTRLNDLPFVVSAGAVTALPMVPANSLDFARPYWREGEQPPEGDSRLAGVRLATPGYFRALGMTLLAGRDFTYDDGPDAPGVIVINESLVRRMFAEENPIGRHLMVDYRGVRPLEIVGVVNDIRFYDLTRAPQPEMYFPHAQIPYLAMTLAVRTTADPVSLAGAIEAAVAEIDPRQPVHSIVSLEQLVSDTMARDRFVTILLGALSVVALVLAATGIYGVTAYVVTRRTREIGMRMALGARERDVSRMVLRESLHLALVGGLAGLGGALAVTRVLEGMIVGIPSHDPVTFLAVSVVVGIAALVAGILPARRAARVDPLVALRSD